MAEPPDQIFLEDIRIGATIESPTATVDRDEMLAFAQQWDQLPIHLDDDAANAAYGGGGITAPSAFLLAMRSRLLHRLPEPRLAVIAAGGWEEMRFHAPLQAGDTVRVVQEFLGKRDSQSKPDRGVVSSRISLVNQADVAVMSHVEATIVRRRPMSPSVDDG